MIEPLPEQNNIVIIDDLTVGKKKDELIIFGRSPFINQLKLDKIDYTRFDVCCINYPIPYVKVNYVVSADNVVKPKLAPKTEWISQNTYWTFLKQREVVQEYKRLSWLHYSSDLAVNFAISRGYKKIYLAGIDLVEDNKPFTHYDGIKNKGVNSNEGLREEKEYIKELAKMFNVEIFQLNPEMDWLEFRDIGIL